MKTEFYRVAFLTLLLNACAADPQVDVDHLELESDSTQITFLREGEYQMNGDADIPFLHVKRKVSVQGFYMDSNECTSYVAEDQQDLNSN
ncbi:MAG: hypothetical protein ACI837_002755 [Crocinitomicaceae bacterium]|jgi:hypothetical protein